MRCRGSTSIANPYFSELLQGQTLNVNSLNYSNRYDTLINKPGHYVTVGGEYGWNDSTELQGDVLATGDFGSRFPSPTSSPRRATGTAVI